MSEESLAAVKKMADLHCEMSPLILRLVKDALSTGEPIVRFMEYNYPNVGYHSITDQFMLGKEILVAPVITKGTRERAVIFPEGKWQDSNGQKYEGGSSYTIASPLGKLLYFSKL